MKRFLLVVLVALVAGGCVALPGGPHGTQLFVMYQIGVTVRVVNNCAPFLDLESVGGIVMKGLPYGDSTTIPMVSAPLSGNYRRMSLTVKGYTASRVYLGSATAEFHVSTYEGSREEVWEVNRLYLPNGRGGCQ